MPSEYTVRGILNADGTLKIKKPLPISSGEVEVIIRPLSMETKFQSIWDIIGQSNVERPKEKIDEQVYSLREEWGK
jgi:hypothetical protein